MIPFWSCTSNCKSIKGNSSFINLSYPCLNNTHCSPVIITLQEGIYQFDLYGASGGGQGIPNRLPGLGGHTRAIKVFGKRTRLMAYLGGQGTTTNESTAKGGWNGGGDGFLGSRTTELYGSGGGSTDIRLTTALKDRILVAGGGGGAGNDVSGANINTTGGHGGGLTGGNGGSGWVSTRKGIGANSSSHGNGGYQSGNYAEAGTDGKGGNGATFWGSSAGGGGGGYFCGGGGIETGGGGGSGFFGNSLNGMSEAGINKGNGYIQIECKYYNPLTNKKPFDIEMYLYYILLLLICS